MNIPRSIFLVEDNKHDQFFFAHALKDIENTFLMDMACHGREALEKLSSSVTLPDLIFTDIHMPVMDGIECLTELLKNPKTKNIPVVVLSTDTAHIHRVREIGARAFITKANDCDKLRERMLHVIHLDFIADKHIADRTFETALWYS